jgi:hypothetical protein
MTLIWFAAAVAALALVLHLAALLKVSKLRSSGLYPPLGQASMADVERLLKHGLPVWAIRCYREIHHCSLHQAKEAVASISGKK